MNHLTNRTLLLRSQHGFTKGKSCLTNLLQFLEDVSKAIGEGKPMDVICLDFSKAFDKVPRARGFCIKLRLMKLVGTWQCEFQNGCIIASKDCRTFSQVCPMVLFWGLDFFSYLRMTLIQLCLVTFKSLLMIVRCIVQFLQKQT